MSTPPFITQPGQSFFRPGVPEDQRAEFDKGVAARSATPVGAAQAPPPVDPLANTVDIYTQKRIIVEEINRRRTGQPGDSILAQLSNQSLAKVAEQISNGIPMLPGEMEQYLAMDREMLAASQAAGGGDFTYTDPKTGEVVTVPGKKEDGSANTWGAQEAEAYQQLMGFSAGIQEELTALGEPKTLDEAQLNDVTVFGALGPGGTLESETGTLLYGQRSAEEVLGSMDADQIIELRENLYFSGYLETLPDDEIAGNRDASTLQALMAAMNQVNLNGGAETVQDFLRRTADSVLANRGGVPIGQDENAFQAYGDSLHSWAKMNGVDLTDGYVDRAIFDMANMGSSMEMEQQKIRENMLAQWYPRFADQIKAGMDLTQIASPYIQQMAQMLELDPNEIGIKDKYIAGILQSPEDVSLYAFQQKLRQDERWQYTQNAYDEVDSMVSGLASQMGL